MQLGTRWNLGAQPPSRVPDAVVTAIRALEAAHASEDTAHWRWTLTWLEGRPVVELDATGETVRLGADGSVTVSPAED